MRNKVLTFWMIFGFTIITFIACEKDEAEIITCSFELPIANEPVIRGKVIAISVVAESRKGEIKTAQLYVDNNNPVVSNSYPFMWYLRTHGMSLGEHTLAVTLWDENGNEANKTMTFSIAENVVEFNPNLTYGTMHDIDGNVYKTIQIGTQTWMAEDLRTMRYRNGDYILGSKSSGLDLKASNTIGTRYNWHTVNSYKNLAPTGWHIPTYAEWKTLINYLGGNSLAGGKLKETGTLHWADPNIASNSSGFTALPGSENNNVGVWWTATDKDYSEAWSLDISNSSTYITDNDVNKEVGLFVRCVKD